jgi:hypothetical protein
MVQALSRRCGHSARCARSCQICNVNARSGTCNHIGSKITCDLRELVRQIPIICAKMLRDLQIIACERVHSKRPFTGTRFNFVHRLTRGRLSTGAVKKCLVAQHSIGRATASSQKKRISVDDRNLAATCIAPRLRRPRRSATLTNSCRDCGSRRHP